MRLVDADALMEKLNVFNDRVHGNEHFLYGIETAKELLEDTPTVTEAEIRAKAIDEFAEKLSTDVESFVATVNGIEADLLTLDYFDEFIFEIAEQLKECE